MDPDYNVPAAAAQRMENMGGVMVPQGSMGSQQEGTTAPFIPMLNKSAIDKFKRQNPFHSLEEWDKMDKFRKEAANAGKKRLAKHKRLFSKNQCGY